MKSVDVFGFLGEALLGLWRPLEASGGFRWPPEISEGLGRPVGTSGTQEGERGNIEEPGFLPVGSFSRPPGAFSSPRLDPLRNSGQNAPQDRPWGRLRNGSPRPPTSRKDPRRTVLLARKLSRRVALWLQPSTVYDQAVPGPETGLRSTDEEPPDSCPTC